MSGQRERVQPGCKLVLSSPGIVLSLDQEDPLDRLAIPKSLLSEHKFSEAALREYFAIYNLLTSVVGYENFVIIRDLNFPAYIDHMERVKTWSVPATVDISALDYDYQAWPRDSLTFLEDSVLFRRRAWKTANGLRNGWRLGEGGAVLAKNRILLVAESLFEKSGDEVNRLSQKGLQVAKLPDVAQFRKTSYIGHHIDGHCSLIEDSAHNLVLFMARSYFLQNRGQDRHQIEMTVKNLGIDLEVIDQDTPPLAFNLVQLDDRTVVMTSGADKLESAISERVGREKIYTTDIPVEMMPIYGGGGIRCMTNIFPQYLIDSK